MKKVFSLFLSLILILSAFVFLHNDVNASEDYLKSRLVDLATASDNYRYGQRGTWKECKGFINSVCVELFGFSAPGQASDSRYNCPPELKDSATRDSGYSRSYNYADTVLMADDNWVQVAPTLANYLDDEPTEANIKNTFMMAMPGDIIQMDYTKPNKPEEINNSIHIMFVYDVTDFGVSFYHYYNDGSGRVILGSTNSGKNPLFNSSVNGYISYSEFAKYFTSEDDGFTIYRAKNYAKKSIESKEEFLDAILEAQTSNYKVQMDLNCDISFSNYEIQSLDLKYSPLIKSEYLQFDHGKDALTGYWAPDTKQSPYYSLIIDNCVIKGNHSLLIPSLYVGSKAVIHLGDSDASAYTTPISTGPKATLICEYLENYGSITICKVTNEVANHSTGSIDRIFQCQNVVNDGKVTYVIDNHFFLNRGIVNNWYLPQNPNFQYFNYGTVNALYGPVKFMELYGVNVEYISSLSMLYQFDGTIESIDNNDIDGNLVVYVGGNVCDDVYTTNSSDYYLKIYNIPWDDDEEEFVLSTEQKRIIDLLKSESKDNKYRWTHDSLENGVIYLCYAFSAYPETTIYPYARELANLGLDYEIVVKNTVQFASIPNGDMFFNANKRTISFIENFVIHDHIEVYNGKLVLSSQINVSSPNTFVLRDMEIEVDDGLNSAPFVCDNGRVVFDNCSVTNNETVVVEFNSSTDVMEVINASNATVERVSSVDSVTGVSNYALVTNEVNGISEISRDNSNDVAYTSLENATNIVSNGENISLLERTEVDDLTIPSGVTLTIPDDVSLIVYGTLENNGRIDGNGLLGVYYEDNYINNGEVSNSLIVGFAEPSTDIVEEYDGFTLRYKDIDKDGEYETVEITGATIITDYHISTINDSQYPVTTIVLSSDVCAIDDGVFADSIINSIKINCEQLDSISMLKELYSDMLDIEHKGTVVDVDEVSATCVEGGFTSGAMCSKCGEVLYGCEEIDSLGHSEVVITAVSATCTESGLTSGTKCSVCDEILVAQEEVTATGHTAVNDAAVAATLTSTGLTAGSHCSVCGEVIVAQTTVPKLTPTPTQDPANTTTPTPAPSQPSTPAESEGESGVAGFVERLYTIALGRNSDPVGKAAWINAIKNGESGADAAKGFLFSDEFLNKDMSNEEFVKTLYKTFFDREADQGGLNAWVAALERGESKQDVIMGFINSTEWANVCLRYGIVSGGTGTPSIEVEPNENVIAFATRLYTTCLKRTPDQGGLMAWARQLANLRDTGTNAAHGFFFSDEMLNNPVSDEEYVTRLYLTFMDRNPDEAGFNAWVDQLKAGASREEVFNGFAASDEFGRICANYGIIR